MKIFFVRHGQDDDRFRGGWSQTDLTEEGVAQAEALAGRLRENQPVNRLTAVFSSDLPRAMTTARIIAAALGLSVIEERALRETNNGDLAGMLNEEALIRYPGLFWRTLDMDEAYPNGESPRDFYRRVRAWLEDFARQRAAREGNVLAVTHRGVIDVIYHVVNDLPWSNKGKAVDVPCCGVYVLNLDTMTFEATDGSAGEARRND